MGNNKFLDGIIWGMLIGGAGVFLFGTKKGKKLLDILNEEGAQGLNKVLKDLEDEAEDLKDEVLENNSPGDPEEVEDIISEKMKHAQEVPHPKPKSKRFFRSSR